MENGEYPFVNDLLLSIYDLPLPHYSLVTIHHSLFTMKRFTNMTEEKIAALSREDLIAFTRQILETFEERPEIAAKLPPELIEQLKQTGRELAIAHRTAEVTNLQADMAEARADRFILENLDKLDDKSRGN